MPKNSAASKPAVSRRSLTYLQPLVTVIAILFLAVVAFLLLVILKQTTLDTRSRADNPACSPQNNQIVISQTDLNLCPNLQQAINQATDDTTISFQPGTYFFSEPITITNKRLTISGDANTGSKSVTIQSNNSFIITDSQLTLQWLELKFETTEPGLEITDSSTIHLEQMHATNSKGTLLRAGRVDSLFIINSEFLDSPTAINVTQVEQLYLENNRFHDNQSGLNLTAVTGTVHSNLFYRNTGTALTLDQPNSLTITHNTLSENHTAFTVTQATQDNSVRLSHNLIVGNQVGIDLANTSPSSTSFEYNDVWSNQTDFHGVDGIVGQNGNLAQDPLLGAGYCLKPGSPAIFGDINKGEFMGYERYRQPLCR